jgi:hypothetical protein
MGSQSTNKRQILPEVLYPLLPVFPPPSAYLTRFLILKVHSGMDNCLDILLAVISFSKVRARCRHPATLSLTQKATVPRATRRQCGTLRDDSNSFASFLVLPLLEQRHIIFVDLHSANSSLCWHLLTNPSIHSVLPPKKPLHYSLQKLNPLPPIRTTPTHLVLSTAPSRTPAHHVWCNMSS